MKVRTSMKAGDRCPNTVTQQVDVGTTFSDRGKGVCDMKKKNNKAKRITKLAQLRVRTGIKSGFCSECKNLCESQGQKFYYAQCSSWDNPDGICECT